LLCKIFLGGIVRTLLQVVIVLFGISSASVALAAGVLETITGDVKAGISAGAATTAKVSQRVTRAMTVVTGPKSTTLIRFEDGQAIALNENSEFRIAEYSFAKDKPAGDKFSFELAKGALRSVTAATTRRTPDAYTLRTTTSTMGIRGTDFLVAIVNPVYFQVLNGSIVVTNTAGTVAFGAGAVGTTATAAATSVTISLSALPASVAASFSQLAGLTITVTGGIGAAAASATATGGLTGTTIGLGIAGLAAAGLVVSNANKDEDQPVPSVTTSTSTGTR
jgi:hypothetical protein